MLSDRDPLQTLAEIRVRYDALRLSDDDECMMMLLAAAAQMAHRVNSHPSQVMLECAQQTARLWGERWGMFVHDMLEADDL